MVVVLRNIEMIRRSDGNKKLNFLGFLTLLYVFATVTCSHQLSQEILPWPLKVQRDAHDICETSDCKEAAQLIKQSLNLSVDPCEDFYEFACGGWISNHPILPTEPQRSQFAILADKVEGQVREILESPIDPEESIPVQTAKKLYNSCLDTAKMEEKGLDPLIAVIDDLGGWPLATENWSEEGFNWQTVVGRMLKEIGTSPLITLYVYKDQMNSSRYILINDQSRLPFPREVLVNSGTYKTHLGAYRKYVLGVATELVEARNFIPSSSIADEVDEIIQFQIKLAEITTPADQRRDPYRMYNLKTIKELQDLTDSVKVTHNYARIDWKSTLDTIFSTVDVTIFVDEPIIVKEVDFIPKLVKLLDDTPLRVIANYIMLKAVGELASYTTNKMRDLAFEFSSTLSGATEQSPRWQKCTGIVGNMLEEAVGFAYVKKYFDQDTKNAARHMVESIRNQFSSSIDDVDWMDASTKRVAKEKVDEMEENIAYPDWYSEPSKLDEYYRGISVGESSYFASMLLLTAFINRQWLTTLRKPTEHHEWLTSPQTVNAFYNPQGNSILLPAGILHLPFFDSGRPKALNYGAMGGAIGHEITHGFDDSGRKSDKHGNLAQWWSQETIDSYEEKTQCFIKQYGSYRVPELDATLKKEVKMNGVLTQGENIADNGGVRQAFFAYKKNVKEHGPDKRLPGLEKYSPEKLFFISFATTWCGTSTLQVTLDQILSDPHSPGKFRVIGTLSNIKEFAEIWQCPVGSPMNPVKKCKIW